MKPTQPDRYRPYEAHAATLKRKLKQEFNRLLLAGFDELNVIRVQSITESIWKRVDRFNRDAYAEMCEWTYEWVYVQYGDKTPHKDWTKVVDDWLRGYDPVTKYIYDRELERKRLRLNEGVLTTRETQDRPGLTDVVRAAANLLLTQSLQYGLDLIGETELEAFHEAPEDEDALSRYNACNDSKTCNECWKLNGKVVKVSEAPHIPQHYRCRCWYTRV